MAIDNMKRTVKEINQMKRAREELMTPDGQSTGAMALEAVAQLTEIMVQMNLDQMEANAQMLEMIMLGGMPGDMGGMI